MEMTSYLSKNQKKKKGFTLIELIIVIAIIGILALIAIPKFGQAQKEAKINADIASAKTIANAASVKIARGEKVTAISQVGDMLQGGVPTPKMEPKAGTKGFTITVDDNGDVTVMNGEDQVYPNQTNNYAK